MDVGGGRHAQTDRAPNAALGGRRGDAGRQMAQREQYRDQNG